MKVPEQTVKKVYDLLSKHITDQRVLANILSDLKEADANWSFNETVKAVASHHRRHVSPHGHY